MIGAVEEAGEVNDGEAGPAKDEATRAVKNEPILSPIFMKGPDCNVTNASMPNLWERLPRGG